MKTYLIAGLALALFSITAHAQTLSSGSGSTSTSGATATSSPHQAQQAQAQAVYAPTINEPAQPANTSARIKNTPDIVSGAYAPSMAPDSCMTTSQVGASVAGIGIAGGHGSPDEACRHLRAAEKRLQIMNAALVDKRQDVADYNLELAMIDACLAEDHDEASCRDTAKNSVYPGK
jgi:hypothetical protein